MSERYCNHPNLVKTEHHLSIYSNTCTICGECFSTSCKTEHGTEIQELKEEVALLTTRNQSLRDRFDRLEEEFKQYKKKHGDFVDQVSAALNKVWEDEIPF